MTRPHIIRADTIDLQDQEAPSAKDHTRQPSRPGVLGDGAPAPHQAEALKHVELEISEQHGRSPRASQDLSGKELGLLHHDDGDSYGASDGPESNLLRNAGSSGAGADEEAGDADGDDGLDDDMMDKISSSPSIGDDGGYHLSLPPPKRGTPPSSPLEEKSPAPETPSDLFSSSPFSETPEHFPLSFPRNEQDQTPSKVHHQLGRPTMDQITLLTVDEEEAESHDLVSPLISEQLVSYFEDEGFQDMEESFDGDLDVEGFHHLLLPADDPLLDNSFDDAPLSSTSTETSSPLSKASWNDNEPVPNDDDTEDISFIDNSRFVDSGWGGECLRETEDIDFEFVYALHTFVATVEGQANATKGDTMVLLDDSNSYWWLVRVVKDSSIGYLPAEHIETPLERLARLNKHRNLDLSQTMLGDEEEKKSGNSLNPLKKAIRRRNAKTVQFSAPSYVEPSDNDYSSEEEEEDNGGYIGQEQNGAAAQENEQRDDVDNTATVEPLKARGQVRDGRPNGEELADQSLNNGVLEQTTAAEDVQTSDETFDRSGETKRLELGGHSQLTTSDDGTASKSRKGTVRNTDSFFKDDGVETRKINLTPSLLRDDSSGVVTKPNELKPRVSLDALEKDASEKGLKDDKKKKEKRGMLGGMFKRKDKKSRVQDKESEEAEKISSDLSRQSPQPKESMESLSQEAQAVRSAPQPYRQTSKLQKSPPAKASPRPPNNQKDAIGPRPSTAESQNAPQSALISEQSRAPPTVSEPIGSTRMVQPEQQAITVEEAAPAPGYNPPVVNYEDPPQTEAPKDSRRGMFSPIKDALRSTPSEPKPEKARKAKNRMHMDDFDSSSSEDETATETPSQRESHEEPEERQLTIAQEAQREEHEPKPLQIANYDQPQPRERLSESPIEIAPPQDYRQRAQPQDPNRTPHQPPPLMVDTSSQEEPSTSPVSSLSSPELVEVPIENTGREETPASTATGQSSMPSWSDASLRAYLEDDSEIRDLLVVVHDKSNIKPARRDHPIVKNMYKEENRKLIEISKRLDGLLGDYLARKGRTATAAR